MHLQIGVLNELKIQCLSWFRPSPFHFQKITRRQWRCWNCQEGKLSGTQKDLYKFVYLGKYLQENPFWRLRLFFTLRRLLTVSADGLKNKNTQLSTIRFPASKLINTPVYASWRILAIDGAGCLKKLITHAQFLNVSRVVLC